MKSERGFAPLVVVLGISLAITLLGGNFLFSKHPQAASFTLPTEKDFEGIQDPRLRKHFVTQAGKLEYRVKSTASEKSGYNLFEVLIKNNSILYRTLENNGTKDISEVIGIQNTQYVKDYSDNTWWKQEAPSSLGETPVNNFELEHPKNKQITYSFIKNEACGKLTCLSFEESDPSYPENKRIFWFDDKDFLLRRDERVFGGFKTTNEYFYEDIHISVPLLTKEVPLGKSINEFASESITHTKNPQSKSKKIQEELDEDSTSGNKEVLDLKEY